MALALSSVGSSQVSDNVFWENVFKWSQIVNWGAKALCTLENLPFEEKKKKGVGGNFPSHSLLVIFNIYAKV